MHSANPSFGNYFYNEIVNYRGSLAEVSNDAVKSAASTIDYHTTSNFRPWMQMGDLLGNLESQAVGKKLAGIDDFPTDYLAMARALFPEFIADPIAILDAPPQFAP
jgi:hypothetical protein